MKIKCPLCGGLGKIIGLGMIEKICPECNGARYVKDAKENKINTKKRKLSKTEASEENSAGKDS